MNISLKQKKKKQKMEIERKNICVLTLLIEKHQQRQI